MEASPSSTSKVTVTYWDPAALYQLISSDLRARLPLRNLHWKSPVRPLRSIDSLHVDLIPYSPPASTLAPADDQLTRVRSTDSHSSEPHQTARSASRSRGPRKERRHQIPGLRNTPYLKVYILRCDDNESYKNTQRKLLREWVSTHAMAPPGDNGHDAYEWLIIHVVLPGTPAAQQPRSSAGNTSTSGPRWMKTGTLLDKIKSDFNGSGPKAVDRIIQIRVPPDNPALNTLSPPVDINGLQSHPETAQEGEEAWLDLIAKFKSQILTSFDARVSQYEEDVKQKDSQRALPGWNFCTFFVLKEGLARAFEAVGLVEDALVLYDELNAGLDTIIKTQEKGEVIGGKFIQWTRENLYWLEEARQSILSRKGEDLEPRTPIAEFDEGPAIDAEKKPYRELILSNEISIFDFRCYLFARQATLLLRLGRRHRSPDDPQDAIYEADNLPRLAELCNRGIAFTTGIARILRADLNAAYQDSPGSGPTEPDLTFAELRGVVDNLVTSWTYSVCTQLLTQTRSDSLPKGLEEGSGEGLLPQRKSSVPAEAVSFVQAANSQISGLEELAAGRAELMMLLRRVVEEAVARRGWDGPQSWYAVTGTTSEDDMEEVDLNDDAKKDEKVWLVEGLRNKELKELLARQSPEGFHALFAELSEKAMRYYGVAKRYKSAERAESDLAALKFHLGQYEEAATHLRRMTTFYAQQGWGMIETTLLAMQAHCLKHLERPKEYLGVLLKLLGKAAAAENGRVMRRAGKFDADTLLLPYSDASGMTSSLNVKGFAAEVYELSQQLGEPMAAPVSSFWTELHVDPYPRYLEGKDGFEVEVDMRYLLDEPLTVDLVSLKLVSTATPPREIIFTSKSVPEMKKGKISIPLYTHQTVPGVYVVESITLTSGKLQMQHQFLAKSAPGELLGLKTNPPEQVKKTLVHMYPSPRGLNARLEMPRTIRLEAFRTVEIVLSSGENDIESGEMRIKSATAGLRLHTGELAIQEGEDSAQIDPDTPSKIHIGRLAPGKEIRLSLPYSCETDLAEIMIRIEADYTTAAGSFGYLNTIGVHVALPAIVKVQDVFKADALFSRFQVWTASGDVPLRIQSVELEDSSTFSATTGVGTHADSPTGILVFARQPASFVYRIRRKPTSTGPPTPLLLKITYTDLSEEIQHSLRTLFTRALTTAGLAHYTHHLLPALLSHFHLPPATLESAALLNSLPLTPPSLTPALSTIPPRDRPAAASCLAAFLAANPTLPLTPPAPRRFLIPVAIPPVHVFHRIDFRLRPDTHAALHAPYRPLLLTAGQTVPAEITIAHHRPAGGTEEMRFFYEVQRSDAWLVAGKRKGHFVGAPQGNVVVIPLLLVPCRPGVLELPEVAVVCVGVGGERGERLGEVVMQEEVRAGSVRVVVDVRSTTVRIGEAGEWR